MGQTDLKPTAQGQVESSINDTINFIMAKVATGEIDAATATELIAAARKDYERATVSISTWLTIQISKTIRKPNLLRNSSSINHGIIPAEPPARSSFSVSMKMPSAGVSSR